MALFEAGFIEESDSSSTAFLEPSFFQVSFFLNGMMKDPTASKPTASRIVYAAKAEKSSSEIRLVMIFVGKILKAASGEKGMD